METGVCGAPYQLALLLAEEELKITPDFAIIQHHPLEVQLVLVQAQKLLLAMHSNAQLVKQTIYNKQLLYLLYYLD
jgi:hypothetical protein